LAGWDGGRMLLGVVIAIMLSMDDIILMVLTLKIAHPV